MESPMKLAITVLGLLSLVHDVQSFSSGAGTQACNNLIPQHGPSPQATPTPFGIVVSQTTPGPVYNVIVARTDGGSNVYRGIVVQALATTGAGGPVGTFTIPNGFQPYDCSSEYPESGVTHTSSDDKNLPAEFVWTAPDGFTGEVIFRATVVVNFATFWTNFVSAPITVMAAVVDPVITCPPNVEEDTLPNLPPGFLGNFADYDAASCTVGDQDNIVCSPLSGSFFQGALPTTVTCTCTDPGTGRTDTCDFTVTIRDATANTPPSVTCPDPLSMPGTLPGGLGAFVTYGLATCTDNEQDDNTLNLVCAPASPGVFPFGPTTVTCTCTDNEGEEDMCSFIVTVTDVAANTPPVITCPGPLSVQGTLAGAVVDYNLATCTDNEQNDNTLNVGCLPASGGFFPTGPTSVTCTCTDNRGEQDECTFLVNVIGGPPPPACDGSPCGANECRPEGNLVGYTCHAIVGTGCN